MKKIRILIMFGLLTCYRVHAAELVADVMSGTSISKLSLGMHWTNVSATVTNAFMVRTFPNQSKVVRAEDLMWVTNMPGFRLVSLSLKNEKLAFVQVVKDDESNVFFNSAREKSKAKLGNWVEESKRVSTSAPWPGLESVQVLSWKKEKEGVCLYKSGTATMFVLYDAETVDKDSLFISPKHEQYMKEVRRKRLEEDRKKLLIDEN